MLHRFRALFGSASSFTLSASSAVAKQASRRGPIGTTGQSRVASQFEEFELGRGVQPVPRLGNGPVAHGPRVDRRFDLGLLVGAQVKTSETKSGDLQVLQGAQTRTRQDRGLVDIHANRCPMTTSTTGSSTPSHTSSCCTTSSPKNPKGCASPRKQSQGPLPAPKSSYRKANRSTQPVSAFFSTSQSASAAARAHGKAPNGLISLHLDQRIVSDTRY